MELNTTSLADFVKLATVIWSKGFMSVEQTMRGSGLVKEYPIPSNSGNTREFSEIDAEEYAKRKGEGDQAERAKIQQGYSKTMTKYRVAMDIGITYEMRTENKYPEVTSRLTNLATQVAKRMDLDLSHRISFMSAVSYNDMDGNVIDTTVGDGRALADPTHTVKGSAVTYRNILANNPKLSKGSLEGMERLVSEETINQFGQKMSATFDILWTTDDPNTVNTAKEYLQSTADITGSNSGVKNVYMSKYRHVVLPRVATDKDGGVDIAKRYYWGLASSNLSSFYLGIWEEPRLKTPANLNAGEEFSTDDWNFGARGGYGIVIVNGTFFKGSKGDGTA